MQYSNKCSIAIHCLLVIAQFSDERRVTSQLLARSAGSNPATIRGIFQQLQEAGLIHVRRGTGGAYLSRTPEQISIWDVYCAVQPQQGSNPLRLHANPLEQCPVGKVIHQVLAEPYSRISEAMAQQMKAYTLQMLLERYAQISMQTQNTTDA